VVLKVGLPNPELRTEILALRAFNGRGMVQLLEADEARGALLLERLEPGTDLLDAADDEATLAACGLLRDFPKLQMGTSEFPTVADWAKGFERLHTHFVNGAGPFPPEMLSRAEGLYRVLDTTADVPVLLHGDLHHWNILSAQRAPWLAIDPKGVIGEPVYEAGAWLRNPIEHLHSLGGIKPLLTRRVDIFVAELGFDRERLLGWAFAQAMLSAWWAYEDKQSNWKLHLEWAELLADLS
jgi:streptomycin 6-kinase